MDITINELGQLTPDSYVLLDMRGDVEVGHGIIPGAIHMSKEEILEKYSGGLVKADEAEAAEREDSAEKKLIIYCARGRISQELAEELRDRGYDAYSLKGGYTSWLLNEMKNQQADEVCAQVEKSIRKKFRKNIWCKFTKAINQYELVKEGDCIAVCISGGKDSMLMAKLMQLLQRYGDVPFELTFLVMDPGYNEKNRKKIEENAKILNVPITVFETNIFDVANSVDKSPCYLCARMRRGYLYSKAKELGCNKIALGHHFDDVIETTLIGMFYASQLKAMIPKLHSTNFEGMELIRPMYCIHEEDIIAWMNYNGLEFIQCACRFTENYTLNNNEGGISKRQEIKMLIRQLKKDNPLIDKSIFNSIHAVSLDTMPGYKTHGKTYSFLDNYYNNERSEEQP